MDHSVSGGVFETPLGRGRGTRVDGRRAQFAAVARCGLVAEISPSPSAVDCD